MTFFASLSPSFFKIFTPHSSYTSINQWVKKELNTLSKSSPSTITQTSPKKDQGTTRNILSFQNQFHSSETLPNTPPGRGRPGTGRERPDPGRGRPGKERPYRGGCSAKPIILFYRLSAINVPVNLLSQPHYYGTQDYYEIHSGMVMICSHNKLEGSSQLNLIDNNCLGFIRQQNYKIIRPFLNCSRSSITRVCQDLKIPVYPDKSNQSMQYSRNRIRKQIIPIIQLFFNPQVEDSLFKFAELITKEQNLLAGIFNTH